MLALESMNKMDVAGTFFNSFELEFLTAATGFKQGAQKASTMDQIAMEKVASRLSKRNLLRAFHLVLRRSLPAATIYDLEYLPLKRAVPIDDAATSRRVTTTAFISPNDRREHFFAAFGDWIGVPCTFKQFKL